MNSLSEEEQGDVLGVFWSLLQVLEGKTDPEKDIIDKNSVECGYSLLNRIGYTKHRPHWEQQ